MNIFNNNNIIQLGDNEFDIEQDFDIYDCGPCPYGFEFENSIKAFRYSGKIDFKSMEVLITAGFRRCGDLYYRTCCKECRECIPIRIPVQDFKASKSQTRIIKNNSDIEILSTPLNYSSEKNELYIQYQKSRHKEENYSDQELTSIMNEQMLSDSGCSFEMDLILNSKIMGFMTVDCGTNTLSAVYSAFDTNFPKRSLGKYFILSLIDLAKKSNFSYVNLGYYIQNCGKMNYKSEFKPFEIFDFEKGEWSTYRDE